MATLVDAISDGTLGWTTTLWSLAAAYSLGAHKFTLAYQQSSGDNAYYYGVDGNSTIFVSNSIQISDFVGREEKSCQARYDLNMAQYGVPGLSFMTRYVMGDNIKTNGLGEGKETRVEPGVQVRRTGRSSKRPVVPCSFRQLPLERCVQRLLV